MERMDVDGNGTIDFEEFAAGLSPDGLSATPEEDAAGLRGHSAPAGLLLPSCCCCGRQRQLLQALCEASPAVRAVMVHREEEEEMEKELEDMASAWTSGCWLRCCPRLR